MNRLLPLIGAAVLLSACGAATTTEQPAEADQRTATAAVSNEADSNSTSTTSVGLEQPEATNAASVVDTEPQYDVFLAAAAEALVGTRFEELAFETPEVVAATGLLLCERMEAGGSTAEVAFSYLDELTNGDPAGADDDQLVLAGALVGSARHALCSGSGTTG